MENLLRCSLGPEKKPATEPNRGERYAAKLRAVLSGSFAYLDRRVAKRAYVLLVTPIREATRKAGRSAHQLVICPASAR